MRDGFDYVEIGFDLESSPALPESFKGLSGSGLWRVPLVESEAGDVSFNAPSLEGVAFFQDPPDSVPAGVIRCHGRRSLYDNI